MHHERIVNSPRFDQNERIKVINLIKNVKHTTRPTQNNKKQQLKEQQLQHPLQRKLTSLLPVNSEKYMKVVNNKEHHRKPKYIKKKTLDFQNLHTFGTTETDDFSNVGA